MFKHRGKAQPIFLDIWQHFIAEGSLCAQMGTKSRSTRLQLLEAVWNLPEVAALRRNLLKQATDKGEFQVVGHDATFKTLFPIIGQQVMSQREGEFHALHTFVGMSGAIAGMSAQAKEGVPATRQAVQQVLPVDARSTTLWASTDSPDTIEGVADLFPNLEGIIEDPIHLVFRLEATTNEKRTAVSYEALQLQMKFRQPSPQGIVYSKNNTGVLEEGQWDCQRRHVKSTGRDWQQYISEPYTSHQQYVDDLLDLSLRHAEAMKKRDPKGRCALEVLKAGSTLQHYGYLSLVFYWGVGLALLHNHL